MYVAKMLMYVPFCKNVPKHTDKKIFRDVLVLFIFHKASEKRKINNLIEACVN